MNASSLWESLPALPEPNGGLIASSAGDQLFISGGTTWRDGQKYFPTTKWAFQIADKQWQKCGSCEPCAYPVMVHSRLSGKEQTTWVLGGNDGQKTRDSINVVHADGTWFENNLKLPFPVTLACGTQIGESIFYAGGTPDATDLSRMHGDAFQISLKDDVIKKISDVPEGAFCLAASATAADKFLIFAGATLCDQGNVVNRCASFAYDPISERWHSIAPYPLYTRGSKAVSLNEENIYIAGGFDSRANNFTNNAFLYNAREDRYRTAPSLPYAAMTDLLVVGDYLYCLGGEDAPKHRSDGFYRIPISRILQGS